MLTETIKDNKMMSCSLLLLEGRAKDWYLLEIPFFYTEDEPLS